MGIATVCSSAFSYIENNEVNRAERNDLLVVTFHRLKSVRSGYFSVASLDKTLVYDGLLCDGLIMSMSSCIVFIYLRFECRSNNT